MIYSFPTSVLVTGGSGTIGRRIVAQLTTAKVTVFAPRSTEVNLLDTAAVAAYLAAYRPAAIIHAAWVPTARDYGNDTQNVAWTAASLHLAVTAATNGCVTFVGAGTCAETPGALPASLYGSAKTAVREVLLAWARHTTMRVMWGRIFYAYSEDNPKHRLFRAAAAAFAQGADFALTRPNDRYDWIHSDDAASALVALLHAGDSAAYDIGTGDAPVTRDAIEQLRSVMQSSSRIITGTAEETIRDVRASIGHLRELGWLPSLSLADGLKRIAAGAHER